MATYYWVGGNGTWDASTTTNWSSTSGGAGGAGVPTAADDAIVNASSGSPNITLSGSPVCASLNTTGATCVTLSTGNLTVYGNFTLSSTTTWSATGTITFAATSGTQVITTNGVALSAAITQDNFGATLQLGGALTLISIQTFTFNNGTLNLNNFTLSTGLFAATNITVNQRVIAFGTGNITTTGFGAAFNINGGQALGGTFSYTGTPTVNISNNSATATTITLNLFATSTAALNVNITTGTYTLTESAGNVYNNLNYTGFAGTIGNSARTISGNLTIPASGPTLTAGTNTTTFSATTGVTQTITTNGRTLDFPVSFSSTTGGTFQLVDALTLGTTRAFVLLGGTLNLNNLTLSTGAFTCSNVTNTRAIQFGTGNITTTNSGSALTVVGVNLTYTGTPTINVSNNSATATTVSMSGFTETNALNVNYTTGTYTLTDTTSIYKNLNFTGFSGTVLNLVRTIYGNLTIPASGGTYSSGSSNQTFAATSGTQTITTNGRTLPFPFTFGSYASASTTFAISGALTLSTANGTLTHRAGTLQFTAGTTNTVTTFVFAGPVTRAITSSTPGTRATLSQATGTVTVFGGTITDSAATGGATFNSYGTNGGNNTGWNFIAGYTGALYWVGGTGTWGTTNTQFALTSGGSSTSLTPDASTPVIVDASSGSPTITLTGALNCASLTTTGATCTFTSTGTPTIAGNMTLSSTTTWSATGTITFSNTGTITTNGVTLSSGVTLSNGNTGVYSGNTITLANALTAGTFTITSGILNLNNFTFSASTFVSTATNDLRTVQFGTTGNITTTGSGTAINITSNGTFSYTGTPTVNVSNNSATATTITLAGFTSTNGLNVNITTGTYTLTETASNGYNSLNYTGFSGTIGNSARNIGASLTIPASGPTLTAGTNVTTFSNSNGSTITVTTNGRTLDYPVTFSALLGGALQLNDSLTLASGRGFTFSGVGTLNLNNFTLSCGALSAQSVSVRAIQFGTGNITLTGSGATYLNIQGLNLTYTGTPTINLSNNSATASTVTLNYFTETNALNFNYTTGTYSLTESTTSTVAYKNLNLTGFGGTFPNTARTIYGNLTIPASGSTLTAGTNATTFAATSGTQTITSNGVTLDFPLTFGAGTGSATYAVSGALTQGSTRAFTIANGTLQLPASTTNSVGAFTTTGTTLKYLTSSSSGTQATISSATNATVTYLSIKDSAATGGAVWDARATSNVNAGNNTGWLFSASNSNFFLLFA